jgi:hypothetical protein
MGCLYFVYLVNVFKEYTMANLLTAFMDRAQVPDRDALQEALKSLKFKLSIDDAYVPFGCKGFIPCTIDGEDSGIEMKFTDSSENFSDAPQLKAQIEDRDTGINIRWGGDPRELASATMIAATLAQHFDALVYRDGKDAFLTADQLVEEARHAFAQLD